MQPIREKCGTHKEPIRDGPGKEYNRPKEASCFKVFYFILYIFFILYQIISCINTMSSWRIYYSINGVLKKMQRGVSKAVNLDK